MDRWNVKRGSVAALVGISMLSALSAGVSVKAASGEQKVLPSREECEDATGAPCDFRQCDYVPPGKTFEQICGKGFRKGWVPRTGPGLVLRFVVGGSIFGSTTQVQVLGGKLTYREAALSGTQAKHFERELTPRESEQLDALVVRHHLLELASQDFALHPLMPDQATFRLFLAQDGQTQQIRCGLPLPDQPRHSPCQAQLDAFRKDLNTILGLAIE